nr:hypothetical protein [uncultured Brevundimonas sp.]
MWKTPAVLASLGLVGSSCSSQPAFLKDDQTTVLSCEFDQIKEIGIATTDQGRSLTLFLADIEPIRLTFRRGSPFEDYYQGDAVKVWIDPEVHIHFHDGRRIGPCS